MKKKITIAIDGFSSTGKSTVAKQLARSLGYIYVDTGAMYRAVTLFAMQNNLITQDFFYPQDLIDGLDKINLKFIFDEKLGYALIYLNHKNVEKEIRTLEVSKFVSKIAAISEVRKKLVAQQQEMGKEKGVVMDGRDIGTVVFPDAELKLFMTASAKERALRRFKEMQANGQKVNFDEVLFNVQERDRLDTTREDSPLVKSEDAIEIDNSHLTLEEQYDKILSLAEEKIKSVQ